MHSIHEQFILCLYPYTNYEVINNLLNSSLDRLPQIGPKGSREDGREDRGQDIGHINSECWTIHESQYDISKVN